MGMTWPRRPSNGKKKGGCGPGKGRVAQGWAAAAGARMHSPGSAGVAVCIPRTLGRACSWGGDAPSAAVI